ncbi:MAG: hypothetical protein K9M49_07280 [Candidatus Marinimicrobia bacterium]|nr:hypothetical protein [Candidatus Neomarinimicrobiota bacterium]MCF7851003.1 hypothetical protein [Candidatus Neomarinimicrobiota bacterium]MCF7904943.1 hypothetical protein [Candidatus Neomarinimicrobiota bacterium]
MNKKLLVMLIIAVFGSVSIQADDPVHTPASLKLNREMVVNFTKSLLIPGWGQWSNGHKGRSVIYLVAELGGIYGYRDNRGNAYDLELEFKQFADDHWDYQSWNNSIEIIGSEVYTCGNKSTHPMPTYEDENGNVQPIKDHHFYENISKYKEFVCGWDDQDERWTEGSKVYTPLKLDYINMRTRSNELYRNAQLAGTLIMVNHLISAFDAAFGTDMTTFESTSYSGKFYINALSSIPSLNLEVKF